MFFINSVGVGLIMIALVSSGNHVVLDLLDIVWGNR